MNLQFGAATFTVEKDKWYVRKNEIKKFEAATQRELHRLESDQYDVDLKVSAFGPSDFDINDNVRISGWSKTTEGKSQYHDVKRHTASNPIINAFLTPISALFAPFSKDGREIFKASVKGWKSESVDKFVVRAFEQIKKDIEQGE